MNIIPINKPKSHDVITPDDHHFEHLGERRVLRLKISSNGYTKHIKERLVRTQTELRKINRFRNLNLNNKSKKKIVQGLSKTYPDLPCSSNSVYIFFTI